MSNTEGRIVLALQAYRQNQISSLRAAARTYDVPYMTLYRRNQGTPSRSDFTSPNLKLTQTKEAALVEWILSMDTRGMPPTKALVQQMAEILLAERVQNTPAVRLEIGKRWVHNFVIRHPELKSRYNRKYDYQRAKCEDPETIRAWFRLVQNTIAKYGILDEDIQF
jgi:Tc5 transposase DNA-binding domain/helix-turn-helix, Psq domain